MLLLFGKFYGFCKYAEVVKIVSYPDHVHSLILKEVIYSVFSVLMVI